MTLFVTVLRSTTNITTKSTTNTNYSGHFVSNDTFCDKKFQPKSDEMAGGI